MDERLIDGIGFTNGMHETNLFRNLWLVTVIRPRREPSVLLQPSASFPLLCGNSSHRVGD